jgi:mannan endo-1,4-beta-mannosidase
MLRRNESAPLVSCIGARATDANLQPANSNATPMARSVLQYLGGLPKEEQNRVLSGQHCGRGEEVESLYREHVVDLHRQTGHWIAMAGADYGRGRADTVMPNRRIANQTLINHWNRGGLVTVTWHSPNPWTGGSAWQRKATSLTDLTDSGSDAHAAWVRELDGVVESLAELSNAGVVVLWRPFHEMNGGWFWWGRRDPEDYVVLWKHMFDYFTKTKKLNNLLWVYSPSTTSSSPAIAYYPGDELCDIVGLDHYAEGFEFRGYAELTALGKPFGITEIGPQRARRGNYDYAELIAAIRDRYPKTVFFQAWAWDWSLSRNKNAPAMLGDPWIIGRDELPQRVVR